MTAQFFKEILTEPALKDFEYLSLDEGEIDAESLDLVMEMAQSNRVLRIKWTEIPKDYYHKNALKFRDIRYWDARWVRIENLLTLKDSRTVELGWNKLTCSDVNTFIKYWIDSDHDVVQSLSSRTSMAFQTEHLFDGIVVLRARFAIYLVLANPTKQRKRPILSITCYDDGMIYMKSYDKDDTFCLWGSLKVESWAPEYKVLQALNKKKELEGEMEEIQKLLDTNQDKNMVEKKNEITRELQNVSQELAGYNLIFRNGVFSKVI
ncbi:hypothetical protein CAEBREN_24325 [Caenorhabditis brenneri]|uniref:Sdz-33 F-box domain-containing protein n=1 Tax=Caenorhabditis brenneri TaxID=135651 RepID=G0PAK8_CAEBE|nr:hypothetical protein CAEBREN_24325 [Caenorhabditis brenneri]